MFLDHFWLHFCMIFDDFLILFSMSIFEWIFEGFFYEKTCFFNDVLHYLFNVFVCAEPSKRKGWVSLNSTKNNIISWFLQIRGVRHLIEIHAATVRFSSRRRRPIRHWFFIDVSLILDSFSHVLGKFFDFFDAFFNHVLGCIFDTF